MAQWGTFVGIASVVLVLVLVLAHLTQRAVSTEGPDGLGPLSTKASPRKRRLSPMGSLGLLLVGAALSAAIPASALGIEWSSSALTFGLGIGSVFGIGLFLVSEGSVWLARQRSIEPDETLREPPSTHVDGSAGSLLAGVALPIVAIVEELLFRAVLIGALAMVSGLSPALLVLPSAVAFGIGHGLQGRLGIAVTALLGLGLGAGYVLTESLLVVIVAHYLVNLLEFVRHEGTIGTTRS
ncbi:MAG: CPBP family intramembrane glutamic endopeptidase [Natrialbaceae archaeon]|nr:CPBP family intramembrane glutamic endopeptidase [Natrialbaceae archaeon]